MIVSTLSLSPPGFDFLFHPKGLIQMKIIVLTLFPNELGTLVAFSTIFNGFPIGILPYPNLLLNGNSKDESRQWQTIGSGKEADIL